LPSSSGLSPVKALRLDKESHSPTPWLGFIAQLRNKNAEASTLISLQSGVVRLARQQQNFRLASRLIKELVSSSNDVDVRLFCEYEAARLVRAKGDEKTLEQLFMNLLENSLRYTDVPGRISISIIEAEENCVLRVEDSSPSVAKEHLPHLFKRLYRVDQSRSRQYGGSGLGLSISRNIVIMHGGDISAKASALGGLAIEVRLKRE
jgi:signal transduction histidine kinase